MQDEDLLANAVKVGDAIRGGLAAALTGVAGVVEIRGMGMMLGVELDRPCGELVKMGLDAGLVFNVTADNVIRLLPPLVMNEVEGRQVVERLVPLVKEFLARSAAQGARVAAAR
jgi:acetylornithine aminotransferase